MKANDLRNFKSDELKEKLDALRKDLMNLRFKRASGELKNPLGLRKTRRDIARVLTILNEKAEGSKTEKGEKQ